MSGFTFDYLSGTVNIPVNAPEAWQREGLDEFYHAPNDPKWGGALCRVLYHESVHFWHFLASAYIANMIAGEWNRLEHFEKTGEVLARSQDVDDYAVRGAGSPFSASELAECWARYWDVHTRSPAQIIRDESIEVSDPDRLEYTYDDKKLPGYTDVAFDTVMQEGPYCANYAEPYRWALKESGNSAFVSLVFPLLAHWAFGSPDPVGVFTESFSAAMKSAELAEAMKERSGNINLDWVRIWELVPNEVILPILEQSRLPTYTSGFDVIQRGFLRTHPIFPEYLEKARLLRGRLKMSALLAEPTGFTERVGHEMIKMAVSDPSVLLSMPGQPESRYLLGAQLPPPRVRFANFSWTARRPITIRELESARGSSEVSESYEPHSLDLEKRIRRFRAAEKAVSLGLSADAFDQDQR